MPHASVPRCPKCDHGDDHRGTGYCGPQNDFGICRKPATLAEMFTGPMQVVITPQAVEVPRHEHLHRKCCCGYEWLERCANDPGHWVDRPAFLVE